MDADRIKQAFVKDLKELLAKYDIDAYFAVDDSIVYMDVWPAKGNNDNSAFFEVYNRDIE